MARPGLPRHRKFLRLARTLGNAPLALGCLELVWEKSYENGDDYLGDVVDVEAAAQWPGEAGALCKALLSAGGDGNHGFIDELEDHPGHYRVHDLFDHAPRYVSLRLKKEMERKAKGISISEIRAEAGRKGAATTNAKRAASIGKASANEQQFVATPAPAPAPAPEEETSLAHSSNERQNLQETEPKKVRRIRKSPEGDPLTVSIYQAYPRKVGRGVALKAIEKATNRVQQRNNSSRKDAGDFIHAAVVKFAESPAGQKGEFTPYCASWMNADRFFDDPTQWWATNGNGKAKSVQPAVEYLNAGGGE